MLVTTEKKAQHGFILALLLLLPVAITTLPAVSPYCFHKLSVIESMTQVCK